MNMDAELSVQDASKDDSGRGVARLSMEVMRELELNSGDTIEIAGPRSTLAVVWPGAPQDTGRRIIRMDASTRSESGSTIGGMVKIRKISLGIVRNIQVHPEEPVRIVGGDVYLKKVLTGRPVHEGQHITINILNTRIRFILSRIIPGGRGIVRSDTVLDLSEEPPMAGDNEEALLESVSYSSIPGLSKQAAGICRALNIKLGSPGTFSETGIPLPKAAFIQSRYGEYAALVARAIAGESGAHFIRLTPHELLTHDRDIFRELLQEVLLKAREYQACVVFFQHFESLFRPDTSDTPSANLATFIK
jgi:transitional endoplasmic reticulum ATPase